MDAWTRADLEEFGGAEEVEISSRRRDGSLRDPVTVWIARVDGDLYVRSVKGREAAWFRGTQTRHEGQIKLGAVARDVTFADADPEARARVDRAYRDNRRYAAGIVGSVLTSKARASTLRLMPRRRTSAG